MSSWEKWHREWGSGLIGYMDLWKLAPTYVCVYQFMFSIVSARKKVQRNEYFLHIIPAEICLTTEITPCSSNNKIHFIVSLCHSFKSTNSWTHTHMDTCTHHIPDLTSVCFCACVYVSEVGDWEKLIKDWTERKKVVTVWITQQCKRVSLILHSRSKLFIYRAMKAPEKLYLSAGSKRERRAEPRWVERLLLIAIFLPQIKSAQLCMFMALQEILPNKRMI